MASILTDELVDKIVTTESLKHLNRELVRTLCQYTGGDTVDPLQPQTLLLRDCFVAGDHTLYYSEVYLEPRGAHMITDEERAEAKIVLEKYNTFNLLSRHRKYLKLKNIQSQTTTPASV